jgi:hypothetical protein
MPIRWLGWAGIEIAAHGQRVVIDPLADPRVVLSLRFSCHVAPPRAGNVGDARVAPGPDPRAHLARQFRLRRATARALTDAGL